MRHDLLDARRGITGRGSPVEVVFVVSILGRHQAKNLLILVFCTC